MEPDDDDLDARDRTRVGGPRQGHPCGRRIHGHDREAIRRDRGELERRLPSPVPPAVVHHARARRAPERRDPVRRDDPPVGRRRAAVRRRARGSRRDRRHQGRHRREAARGLPRRNRHRGARRAAGAARRLRLARSAIREVAGHDHDRRRICPPRARSMRTPTRWRATQPFVRKPAWCRSWSPRS